MLTLRSYLKTECPYDEGVGLCVGSESTADPIKRTDMTTYSVRADQFVEAEMLSLAPAEFKMLEPLRALNPKTAVILEVGGGNGRFAIQLLREGYAVVETDIAIGSVKRVRQVAAGQGLRNGAYAVVDAEQLPFRDAAFDAVFMAASLHHLPSPQRAIAEAARVLKPGGILGVFREPASWPYYAFSPVFRALKFALRKKNKNPVSLADDVTHGFTRGQLRRLLGANYEQVTIRPVQYFEKVYLNYLALKTKLFNRKYAAGQRLTRALQAVDRVIAKVPLLEATAWDWDVTAVKKK